TLDRRTKCILMLYTPCGGMDIEELAANSPEKLLRLSMGLRFDPAAVERALAYFGLPEADQKAIRQIAGRLFQMFLALDATTVEINPLAKLADGSFTAADAKLVIDDNALYRQGDYTLIPRQRTESERARQAREAGLSYVELDRNGNLGVIAGGAGIGMTTVDTISYYGGKAFNFLDLGGGVTREKTCAALTLLLSNPQVKGVLVNVFGGINNCKTIAEGVEDALLACPDTKAEVVVKSRGFSQEEGWQIFDRLGLGQVRYGTTDDAVKLLMKRLEARA
ncbi:MAG: ATP-grasp domain-containing protein, partial [Oscillospiraceae bacterium]